MRGRLKAHLRSTQDVSVSLQIPVSVSVLPDWYVFDVSVFVLPQNGSSRPAKEGEVSIAVALMLQLEPEEVWDTPIQSLTDSTGRASIQVGSAWPGIVGGVLRILATHMVSGAAVWKTLTIDAQNRVTWLGSGTLASGSAMPAGFKQLEPGGNRERLAPYERAGMGWRGRWLHGHAEY